MKKFHVIHSKREPMPFSPTFESRPIDKVDDGHVVRSFELVEIQPEKVNEGLSVKDFSLDVLIANNAVDLLKETKPIPMSNLAVASTVENFE